VIQSWLNKVADFLENSFAQKEPMSGMLSRRRLLSVTAKTATAIAASNFFVMETFAQSDGSKYQPVFPMLDQFVAQYMLDMNSPGLTLVLADKDGVQRVATYGFTDLESKIKVKPEDLFQIGSISKSFLAFCLLQLRDEGKLDFNKPVTEYIPWFRIDSSFAPITIHHLLTHSSGLPNTEVFPSDPNQKHRAAYEPGKYFHYCNMAFEALGHLLWTLDGRPLPEALRERIFQPLGMTQTEPVINLDLRQKIAKNYAPFKNDRPFPRYGRLCEAPAIITSDGAGCIASTPHDMGLYIQMITNRGHGPKGRVVSEESFALFSGTHVKADEFGPTASYGYGIAVDTLEGHKILRHTGGMVSFMSSIQVDVDEGVGAFSSVNAMQGYRPNPVTEYAIRLMRALRENKSLPPLSPPNPPTVVNNAADYAGTFSSPDGRKLEFIAKGQTLLMVHLGQKFVLEPSSGDNFNILHPKFDHFTLVFARADDKDPKSPIVEAGWGGDWFYHSRYSGPKQFEYPKEWESYVGHYRNENPWVGSTRVVIRKGKLMLDGTVPLEKDERGVFYMKDEEHNPEWVSFGEVINGKCMRIKVSGEDLWRVITA
jgi:CubicO group peptidase (beta-lactamase class C family)